MSDKALQAFPFDAWHDDDGDVLWWWFPICEPPYLGSPLNDDWPFDPDEEPKLAWTRFDIPVAISPHKEHP